MSLLIEIWQSTTKMHGNWTRKFLILIKSFFGCLYYTFYYFIFFVVFGSLVGSITSALVGVSLSTSLNPCSTYKRIMTWTVRTAAMTELHVTVNVSRLYWVSKKWRVPKKAANGIVNIAQLYTKSQRRANADCFDNAASSRGIEAGAVSCDIFFRDSFCKTQRGKEKN